MSFHTAFGSLSSYEKGHLEIINDNPKYYVFSNVFEVASKSRPYEKVAVAKNLEYVVECVRAEGTSSWYAASHDEFCVVMDGEVTVEYVKLDNHSVRSACRPGRHGAAVRGAQRQAHGLDPAQARAPGTAAQGRRVPLRCGATERDDLADHQGCAHGGEVGRYLLPINQARGARLARANRDTYPSPQIPAISRRIR